MLSSKKSQYSVITAFIFLVCIGLFLFTAGIPMIADIGGGQVERQEITGISGFFYTYGLPLVIIIMFMIAVLSLGRTFF